MAFAAKAKCKHRWILCRSRIPTSFSGLAFGFAAVLALTIPPFAFAQSASPSKVAAEPKEEGIPIHDQLTIEKCSKCHLADAKGNLHRLSWLRTTPEGWEEAIKRMVRLNGLQVTPDEARHIVRYLSDEHGIAPEELKPFEYYAEHRVQDETFPDPDYRHACASCHMIARPLTWHRSADDWKLLENMHRAMFPSSTSIAFDMGGGRRGGESSGAEQGPQQTPAEKTLDWLAKSSPLHTASWSEWSASMTVPKLTGRWLVQGAEPGHGRFFGEVTIAAGTDPGSFTTKTELKYADGATKTLDSTGAAFVYTGYQWRGRSTVSTPGTSAAHPGTVREVMLVSPNQSEMEGRWFWGVYQEFGMDVKLTRASAGATVLGTDAWSLKSGTTGNKVTIYGDHLPADVTAADISFGAGTKVTGIDSKSDSSITVAVDVEPSATTGLRSVTVKDLTAPRSLAVYDKIDFLKVTPNESMAHLGSEHHTKGYVQFQALAYNAGPDGKPGTADDVNLGPIKASWKLEEFISTFGDDDTKYVGTLDEKTGFFTPGSDGPSPTRNNMRNNYGDVWAVATYTPEGAKEPVTGKSFLVVTVPTYVNYDQPEVAQ